MRSGSRTHNPAESVELAIAVDLFTDLYLGLLFIVPLFRGTWHSSRLRGIAVRSSVASVISMCSTVTNLSLWIGMHGSEISWMCLAICTLDTVVNATALFAVRPSFLSLASSSP